MIDFKRRLCSNPRDFVVYLLTLLLLTANVNALAEEPNIEGTANAIFKAFSKTKQLENELLVSSTSAVAVQDYYIALLRPTWGMDVGYAAVGGNDGMKPLTGVLLENMFTGTRAIIDRSLGVRMSASAELLFRVGSEEFNLASDRLEALATLKTVIPGVRLTDALLAGDKPGNNAVAYATNLQLRMCVLGGEVKLAPSAEWIERLERFSVVLYDENKEVITDYENSGATNPLDAVLLVRDALNDRGIILRENDLIALGPVTEGIEVTSLARLRAEFHGLSDDERVFVYMGFR